MNSSLMMRAARLAKPGMFVAALASIAAIAAATQLRKIGTELEDTIDELSTAQQEMEVLETKKASLLVECQGIVEHRDDLLAHLRGLMETDIANGKYDDAVNARANILAGHRVKAGDAGELKDVNV